MKICLAFIILLSTVLSSYAQDKGDSLPYPELIPILKNGLFGYCDKDKNIKIKPKFEHAELFEEDFSFQVLHVNNPEIIKYGTDAYAWVVINGERYRINKNGEEVYRYHEQDFKKGETAIHLRVPDSVQYVIESVDTKTLFQKVRDIRTGKSIFRDSLFLKELKEKNKDLVAKGVTLVYYSKFVEQPYSYFTSETTFLMGIKNTQTGEIIIKARYASIDELYNNELRVHQYPLFIGYRGDLDKNIYVGLDGTEYIIQPENEPEPK